MKFSAELQKDWSDEGWFDCFIEGEEPVKDTPVNYSAELAELKARTARKDALAALAVVSVGALLIWGVSESEPTHNTQQVRIETPTPLPLHGPLRPGKL